MTKLSKRLPDDYAVLLAEVKERVRSAQYEALKAVNKELVALYWDIGKLIAERQNREGWGKSVVERLANDLQNEFPGVKGFSIQNLWYMRQFCLEYRDNEKLQPLVGEISWSKNLIVMARSKDLLEREFYIRMTRKFGWSKNVLIHQIENQSYEKTLLGQTNFDKALTPGQRAQAKLAVKDEYTFDFLEMGEAFSGMLGLSPYNLKYMRSFAAAWSDRQIVQEVLAQITWYHNIALCGFQKPIGVAEWETRLVESLPEELKGSLPTVEEIEAELAQRENEA
jgi:Uncharacterized conserved protein